MTINSIDAPENINVRLILRLNEYGTYETNKDFKISLKETRPSSVYVFLNDMLNTIYSQQDKWPQVVGTYELYINNNYVRRDDLALSPQ